MADKLIITKDGIIEQNFTPEEIAQREQEAQNYTVTPELVDEEKAILAEAVISLTNEIEQLKARIQTLEGGV